ncbi:hypothetical protein PR048_007215 [Dryococelus australis]|uniref:Uncharacterized protein n=1 Tax=Dryococelus australis TaxID=614101 RepID=A0ABQ9ID04_9NEOP|nr:hypothetical protein PR048_007215 [Dryococelus australis]
MKGTGRRSYRMGKRNEISRKDFKTTLALCRAVVSCFSGYCDSSLTLFVISGNDLVYYHKIAFFFVPVISLREETNPGKWFRMLICMYRLRVYCDVKTARVPPAQSPSTFPNFMPTAKSSLLPLCFPEGRTSSVDCNCARTREFRVLYDLYSMLDSTALCIFESPLSVHWLLIQHVVSFISDQVARDSVLVSLQACYWLRVHLGKCSFYCEQPICEQIGTVSVLEHYYYSTLISIVRKTVLAHGPRWCSGYTTRLPPKLTELDSRRGRSRILAYENRVGLCRWLAGFLGNLPFPSPFHSGAAPYSPRFTLIGSQYLDVKSRQNLSTNCTVYFHGNAKLSAAAHVPLPHPVRDYVLRPRRLFIQPPPHVGPAATTEQMSLSDPPELTALSPIQHLIGSRDL